MSYAKSVALVVAVLWLGLAACTGGSRAVSCSSDGDCRDPKGKFCVTYTCVQCRSEDDCSLPLMCVSGNKCGSIGLAKREPAGTSGAF
jgi:hypothetical protein